MSEVSRKLSIVVSNVEAASAEIIKVVKKLCQVANQIPLPQGSQVLSLCLRANCQEDLSESQESQLQSWKQVTCPRLKSYINTSAELQISVYIKNSKSQNDYLARVLLRFWVWISIWNTSQQMEPAEAYGMATRAIHIEAASQRVGKTRICQEQSPP